MRGTRIQLDKGKVAQVIGWRNVVQDVNLKKGIYMLRRWNMNEKANRFGGSLRQSRYDARMAYFVAIFGPLYHVLFYLFDNNAIPKKSRRNELRKSDLYFLDVMFIEDARACCIPLPNMIISYMRIVA